MQTLTDINIQVDNSILFTLRESKKEFTRNLLFNNALILYRKNKLSLGKAAELSGYSRLGFIQKLQDEGEYIFDYDDETVDDLINKAGIVSEMIGKR